MTQLTKTLTDFDLVLACDISNILAVSNILATKTLAICHLTVTSVYYVAVL